MPDATIRDLRALGHDDAADDLTVLRRLRTAGEHGARTRELPGWPACMTDLARRGFNTRTEGMLDSHRVILTSERIRKVA